MIRTNIDAMSQRFRYVFPDFTSVNIVNVAAELLHRI